MNARETLIAAADALEVMSVEELAKRLLASTNPA